MCASGYGCSALSIRYAPCSRSISQALAERLPLALRPLLVLAAAERAGGSEGAGRCNKDLRLGPPMLEPTTTSCCSSRRHAACSCPSVGPVTMIEGKGANR